MLNFHRDLPKGKSGLCSTPKCQLGCEWPGVFSKFEKKIGGEGYV